MKRLLSVLLAGVLASSASADNLMVSYAAPLAAYPAGGPPIVHPIYSYLGTPSVYSAYPYFPNYGYQAPVSPFYANQFWPGYGMMNYGYGGYGLAYGVGYSPYMTANPNVPTYAFGYTNGYAAPYALGFDGTTATASFVSPPLLNDVSTTPDLYYARNHFVDTHQGAAKLTVNVPADAIVSIQGEKTNQIGPTRTFITPALSGPAAYDVKVTRSVDGKEQEHTMTVMLHPNQQSSISVLR